MTPYLIYGLRRSYFTRKLEAAFQLMGLPFAYRPKDATIAPDVEAGAGTHQIPALQAPDGTWTADTTPIIARLGPLAGAHALIPDSPEGIVVRLVEEWLDEWLPRAVIHYRWNYADNAVLSSTHMSEEILPGGPSSSQRAIAQGIADWGRRAARALGVDSPHQQATAEAEVAQLMDVLEAQLATTRFALGDRACSADATLLGALNAHLLAEPVTRARLSGCVRVQAWARQPRPSAPGSRLPPFPSVTPFTDHVLTAMAGTYSAFLVGNAAALAAGQKAFTIDAYGQPQSYRARQYPEASRQMIQAAVVALCSEDRARVEAWLAARGLGVFLPAADG